MFLFIVVELENFQGTYLSKIFTKDMPPFLYIKSFYDSLIIWRHQMKKGEQS